MKKTLLLLCLLTLTNTVFAQTEEFAVTETKKFHFEYRLGEQINSGRPVTNEKGRAINWTFNYKGREIRTDFTKSKFFPVIQDSDTLARWDYSKKFFIGSQEYRVNHNGTKKWTFLKDRKPVLEGKIENREGKKYYSYQVLTKENQYELEVMSLNKAQQALVTKSNAPLVVGLAVMLGVIQFAANR